jgi:DNA-binding CsgD family transcriptional regulator
VPDLVQLRVVLVPDLLDDVIVAMHPPRPTVPMNTYDPLLLQIYGSCTDMKRWSHVLDELCAQTGAVSAVLQGLHLDGKWATTAWMAHDSSSDANAYNATIADAGNPRLDAKRIQAETRSKIVSDDDLFQPGEEPLRARLNAQLASMGLGRFVGALVPLGEGRYAALALHRRPSDIGDFSARALDRLNALLPHFGQAVSISESMATNSAATALLQGHLDSWPCAMVVCDALGHVRWLNRRATNLLSAGGELQCSCRRLRATSIQAQQRLVRVLKQAEQDRKPGFAGFDTSAGRLHVAVQQLGEQNAIGGLLLVTLTGEDTPGHIPVEAIKILFELTDSEARIASALVGGMTVEQYAQLRGVTVGTARYQMNQVLKKTGAHRQADLVRRVLCCAAAHVASRNYDGPLAH